ncbi:hypothetical protein ABT247_31580 [Kitasatospora sp. NPDC001539]|uniref:hypothetical protein n=1 Tax=Kitasatospora sp. NPDC001539 TaxID=3154384 RepID=UPI00331A5314
MPVVTNRHATAARTLAGTVLAAALLVPTATACGSASDTSASTAAAAPATTPAATAAASTTPDPKGTGSTTPAVTPPGPHATTAPAAPAATPDARRSTAPAAAGKGSSPVRTQTLVDGSTAEIRDLGNQRYQARIVSHGDVLATLETTGTDAGLDANDMFVVLLTDGTVHSWMGGGHQGPGTFKLAGGWTARVTKVGELHYRAQLLGNDNAVAGTWEANQHDAGGVANGVHLVLTAGGEISAHL